MKFKVTLGGYTDRYLSSRLSAIKHAKKISSLPASNYAEWTQTAIVATDFERITFRNGARVSKSIITPSSDDGFYY